MKIRHLILGFSALATSLVAQAQIVFTINATPTANALGYVTSQNYNFVFTLNTAPDTGNDPFQPGTATAGANYTWIQEWTFSPEIWTSVSGNGLAGTWTEPSSGQADPFSRLIASTSSPSLSLYAGADVSNVGLTATGLPVKFINFAASYTGLNYTNITGTLPDPNAYFANYFDSYGASSTTTGWIQATGPMGSVNAFFTINSLTVAAIPEPSTYVALTGAVALGFAIWRRRRQQPAIA